MRVARRLGRIASLKAMRFGAQRNNTAAHGAAGLVAAVVGPSLLAVVPQSAQIHPGLAIVGTMMIGWFALELVDASTHWRVEVARGVLTVTTGERTLIEAPLHDVEVASEEETLRIYAPGKVISMVSTHRPEDLAWLVDELRRAREAFGSPADIPAELRATQGSPKHLA
ncbi:MAG: hypothetical protein H6736_22850 [Alphaproteobacteria bacterium]|nr:hypothetical protein [Alphaproteobacteria bacterium]